MIVKGYETKMILFVLFVENPEKSIEEEEEEGEGKKIIII
jgi:hypothetical protein